MGKGNRDRIRLKMRYLRFCKISLEEVRVTMTGEN